MKTKLLDKSKELESCQKQISSLKQVLRRCTECQQFKRRISLICLLVCSSPRPRSEREKSLLQDRLKSVQKKKSGFSFSVPASDVSGEETFALKSQIHELNNQVSVHYISSSVGRSNSVILLYRLQS